MRSDNDYSQTETPFRMLHENRITGRFLGKICLMRESD